MKLVINKCFGGFGISKAAAEILKIDAVFDFVDRDDKNLIALIEERGSEFCSSRFAKLRVIEIHDSTTDYVIDEYDGMERVIYVLNGKLHFA